MYVDLKKLMIKDEYKAFKAECRDYIEKQYTNDEFADLSSKWYQSSLDFKYSYNFEYLGRPIIQYPQDLIAIQEIIHQTKPELIIETGIAHGGSLIFPASMLALLDIMEGIDPKRSNRKVIGIDIEIKPHNRKAIEDHPLSYKLNLIEGSSIDSEVVSKVRKEAKAFKRIMLLLDSNHTHDHVFNELESYADLVSLNSYCVISDTSIEKTKKGSYPSKSWDVGNSPLSALKEWLKNHAEFEIDTEIDKKLMISVSPNGYIKRIK